MHESQLLCSFINSRRFLRWLGPMEKLMLAVLHLNLENYIYWSFLTLWYNSSAIEMLIFLFLFLFLNFDRFFIFALFECFGNLFGMWTRTRNILAVSHFCKHIYGLTTFMILHSFKSSRFSLLCGCQRAWFFFFRCWRPGVNLRFWYHFAWA